MKTTLQVAREAAAVAAAERERIVAMLREPDFALTMMVCEEYANLGRPMPKRYAVSLLSAIADHIEATVEAREP